MPAPTAATRRQNAYCPKGEELAEWHACHPNKGIDGFLRFCTHLRIKDKRTGRAIPFDLWDCQQALAGDLVAGLWLLCLKARQMGMTWLVAAYALWRMMYQPYFTVIVICQSKPYAEDFVADKVKFMYENLPPYLQIPIARETRTKVKFGHTHQSEIQAFADSKKAGRSLTANLFIIDEAAYCENIEETHRAATPTLEESDGQSVLISTSNGPSGFFYDEAEKSRKGEAVDEESTKAYKFVFWSVFDHPRRDQAWYERTERKYSHRKNHMQYEFPRTPDEAFTSAGGRIYPLFTKQMVPDGHLLDLDASTLTRRPEWKRYRMIDWGTTKSAFVCLWGVHIPAKKPRLTVHPECTNLIREMLAYAYKQDTTEPDKKNDHGPDALRYGIVTFNLTGHVHVYRELYIYDIVAQGCTCQSIIAMIKERSGWEITDRVRNIWKPGADVEAYAGTCYDRSNAVLQNEFWQMKEQAIPHTKPVLEGMDSARNEVANGIALVNKLVVGGMPNRSSVYETEADRQRRMLERRDPMEALGLKVAIPLRDMILKNEQKRRRAARRRKRNWAGNS